MNRVIKWVKNLKFLWFFLGMVLLFYGMFVRPNYATDTYSVLMHGPEAAFGTFVRSGRFVSALLIPLALKMELAYEAINALAIITTFAALALALYILHRMLCRNMKNEWLAALWAVAILLNPFAVELFLYMEKGVMMMSILSAVLAVKVFLKYMDTKRKKYIAGSVALGVLTAMCYQTALGMMIVLMTLFIVLESNKFKNFVKYTLCSVLIYAASCLADLLLVALINGGSARAKLGGSMGQTIKSILKQSLEMGKLYDIVPLWPVVISILIILGLFLWPVLRRKRVKLVGQTLAQVAYLVVVAYLAAVLPQLAQQGHVWLVARSTYAFGMVAGVCEYFVLVKYSRGVRPKQMVSINAGAALAGIILLVAVWAGSTRIIMDHYETNALDRQRVMGLHQKISEYEASAGEKVTKIRFMQDKHFSSFYPHILATGDINVSALATNWSNVEAINYWTGRKLLRVTDKMAHDKAMEAECRESERSYLDGDDVKFVGDTAYVCLF